MENGIDWTEYFIQKNDDKIDWGTFSRNTGVNWTTKLLDNYSEKLNWLGLSSNKALPWLEDFIDKYESKWYWPSISDNTSISQELTFLSKYKSRLDWTYGLFRITSVFEFESFYTSNISKFDGVKVSINKNLQISDSFIDKYKTKIKLSGDDGLSANKSINWTYSLMKRYESLLDWYEILQNQSINWDISWFNQFQEYWHKYDQCKFYLSMNRNFPWTIDFIKQNESIIDLLTLTSNESCWNKAFMPFVDDIMIENIIQTLNKP